MIIGQSGSGKSSLVNMIAQRDVAVISGSTVGCTTESQSYNVEKVGEFNIRLWDTAGLNEANQGSVASAVAIANICKLVDELQAHSTGLSLIIYCVRGRIQEATVMGYNMIRSICNDDVPLALVVTGLENEAREGWWDDNQAIFQSRGMDFKYHACVVTCKGPKRNDIFLYGDHYLYSTKVVHDMIRTAIYSATPM